MKKITISITKNGYKLVTLGKRKTYNSPGKVMSVLKRKFSSTPCLDMKEKMVIVVKEGREVVNESLPTNDPKYLLYSAKVFLEDLPKT